MGKIKNLLRNKWVGFTLAALLYTLWFVVWTGNLWLLLGLPVIFDLYITKFFYRYVWSHNVKMCQRSKTYRTVYEWVNAIIFATVVATLVHLFIFQMYVIPTSSMERTLLIGDYLYVSKVAYGPQMPNTPLSFPFVHHTMPFSQTKKSFSEAIKWPYHRLKGLKPIRRNDVVVFNFPAGDTVLLENQNVTYYDTLRSFEESFGKEEGRKRLNEKYTVISRPVDKRENYIKRCVGLPGDSLEVRNGKVWVNGEPQEAIPGLQYNYVVQTSAPFTQYAIDNLGIREYSGYGSGYYMNLTDELAEKVRGLSNVISVNRYIYTPNDEVFPQWGAPRWSQDNYGPIWIPKKGDTVQLTAALPPHHRGLRRAHARRARRTHRDRRQRGDGVHLRDELLLDDGRQPPQLGRLAFLGLRARGPHRGQGVVRMAVARCGKEFPREHPLGTALQKGSVDVAGDSYRTVAAPAEAACRERSSKFLSWIYPVRTEEEIRERLDALRKRYYDATHHCYAWRLGPRGEAFRANDDGEPSGTAGKPILGQLLSNDITDCLVVVVRYFGGTKLGVPGLIAAYRESAAEAIAAAEIVELTVDRTVRVDFPYVAMNAIMRVVKEQQPRIEEQTFDNLCTMRLAIRESRAAGLIEKLRKAGGSVRDEAE